MKQSEVLGDVTVEKKYYQQLFLKYHINTKHLTIELLKWLYYHALIDEWEQELSIEWILEWMFMSKKIIIINKQTMSSWKHFE